MIHFAICLIFVTSVKAETNLPESELSKMEIKERKILSSIFDINKKLKKLEKEKSVLDENKQTLRASIQNLSEQVLALEELIHGQQQAIKLKLKSLLKFKNENYLRVLLSSQGTAELERNIRILSMYASHDVTAIRNYLKLNKDLIRQKQKLTFRLEKLTSVEKNILQNENELNLQNDKKTFILSAIRKSKKSHLSQWMGSSLISVKGQLSLPSGEKLKRPFGYYNDSEFKLTLLNKGWLFQHSENSKVFSVYDGTVSFVGNVPGYGQTIIIDHGDHYYSVYGNAQEIQIKEGDLIKARQLIAMASSSSAEDGAGLYFELRHFSEPMNPQLWLKGQL